MNKTETKKEPSVKLTLKLSGELADQLAAASAYDGRQPQETALEAIKGSVRATTEHMSYQSLD